MEAALIAYLLEQSGITDLAGNRITWGRRAQGASGDAIVLHRVDGSPDYHLSGPSGLVASRIQVDCWADGSAGYGRAKALARAVESVTSAACFTRGPIRFDAILIQDERDDTFDENGTPIFRTSLDLAVHHASAS